MILDTFVQLYVYKLVRLIKFKLQIYFSLKFKEKLFI